jgi:hypothetical protein
LNEQKKCCYPRGFLPPPPPHFWENGKKNTKTISPGGATRLVAVFHQPWQGRMLPSEIKQAKQKEGEGELEKQCKEKEF